MIADVGEALKVAGRRSPIAPAGPMPGRTPTSVPTKTPIKQKKILFGSKATWKPYRMLSMTPMATPKNSRNPSETKHSVNVQKYNRKKWWLEEKGPKPKLFLSFRLPKIKKWSTWTWSEDILLWSWEGRIGTRKTRREPPFSTRSHRIKGSIAFGPFSKGTESIKRLKEFRAIPRSQMWWSPFPVFGGSLYPNGGIPQISGDPPLTRKDYLQDHTLSSKPNPSGTHLITWYSLGAPYDTVLKSLYSSKTLNR